MKDWLNINNGVEVVDEQPEIIKELETLIKGSKQGTLKTWTLRNDVAENEDGGADNTRGIREKNQSATELAKFFGKKITWLTGAGRGLMVQPGNILQSR